MTCVALDITAYREPSSGVQRAVLEGARAELPFLGEFPCRVLGGPDCPEPSSDNTQFVRVAWSRSPAARLAWQQAILPRWLGRNDCRALQACAYTAPLAGHTPVLLQVHDLIALEYPSLCSILNSMQMRMLLPASVRKAARCLVSTRAVADRLMAVLDVPSSRILVAPFGVDHRFFAAPGPAPAITELAHDEPYFLFLGNIEPKKNIGVLLDAYSRYAASGGRTALVIAGRYGWKSKKVLASLRTWRGAGHVIWLGRVPQPSLPGLLQRASWLVMPSLVEGFGMPVLEAMAAGTPVIHSDAEALVEVAGSAGLVFPRLSPDELARRLHEADDTRRRQDCHAAALERAALFTWEKYGRMAADALLGLAIRTIANP